jgi:hypothetical protein
VEGLDALACAYHYVFQILEQVVLTAVDVGISDDYNPTVGQ